MVDSELKICTKCNCLKSSETDFYMCQGRLRSECKACTISKNVIYQKKKQSWKKRAMSDEEQKSYMVDYYGKNKEKFAEYRRKFKENHPEYYKEYFRKKK